MDYLALVFYFSSFRQRWLWRIFDLNFLFLLFFVLSDALFLSPFYSNSDLNNFSKLTFSFSLLKRLLSLPLTPEEHPLLPNLFEILSDIWIIAFLNVRKQLLRYCCEYNDCCVCCRLLTTAEGLSWKCLGGRCCNFRNSFLLYVFL